MSSIITVKFIRVEFRNLVNRTLYLREDRYKRNPVKMSIRDYEGSQCLLFEAESIPVVLKFPYEDGKIDGYVLVKDFLKNLSFPEIPEAKLDLDAPLPINPGKKVCTYEEYLHPVEEVKTEVIETITPETATETAAQSVDTETAVEEPAVKKSRTRKKKAAVATSDTTTAE